MQIALSDFIKDNGDELFYTGGISMDRITEVEDVLKLTFTKEYKKFLQEYGVLIGFGVEILGCGKSEIPSVVRETKRYRKIGLPKEYVVIRNMDEWVYCLDIYKDNLDICPVVSWDRQNKNPIVVAKSFEEYLYKSLVESKDSWEED